MAKRKTMWAQGDVLVILRGSTKEQVPEAKKGQLVLEGEATGHNHLLYGRVALFRDDAMARAAESLYLTSARIGKDGAELRHEKNGKLTGDHNTIKLPPNSIVEVRRQRQHEGEGSAFVAD